MFRKIFRTLSIGCRQDLRNIDQFHPLLRISLSMGIRVVHFFRFLSFSMTYGAMNLRGYRPSFLW